MITQFFRTRAVLGFWYLVCNTATLVTWQEQHENVEECSLSARPSHAAPTAPSASHACFAMRGVQMPVLCRHRGWRPRAAITSPKGHIHECGLRCSSCVSRPSSCYSSTAIWTCCQSMLLQTSHPKLMPDRADSSSQDC
jgi:hypothetical protein